MLSYFKYANKVKARASFPFLATLVKDKTWQLNLTWDELFDDQEQSDLYSPRLPNDQRLETPEQSVSGQNEVILGPTDADDGKPTSASFEQVLTIGSEKTATLASPSNLKLHLSVAQGFDAAPAQKISFDLSRAKRFWKLEDGSIISTKEDPAEEKTNDAVDLVTSLQESRFLSFLSPTQFVWRS